MPASKHEWQVTPDGQFRLCARCFDVQHHDGRRWRPAAPAVQGYVHAVVMMGALAMLVEQPTLITGPLESLGKALRLLLDVTELER